MMEPEFDYKISKLIKALYWKSEKVGTSKINNSKGKVGSAENCNWSNLKFCKGSMISKVVE